MRVATWAARSGVGLALMPCPRNDDEGLSRIVPARRRRTPPTRPRAHEIASSETRIRYTCSSLPTAGVLAVESNPRLSYEGNGSAGGSGGTVQRFGENKACAIRNAIRREESLKEPLPVTPSLRSASPVHSARGALISSLGPSRSAERSKGAPSPPRLLTFASSHSMAAGILSGMKAARVPHSVNMCGAERKRMPMRLALPLSCHFRIAAEMG